MPSGVHQLPPRPWFGVPPRNDRSGIGMEVRATTSVFFCLGKICIALFGGYERALVLRCAGTAAKNVDHARRMKGVTREPLGLCPSSFGQWGGTLGIPQWRSWALGYCAWLLDDADNDNARLGLAGGAAGSITGAQLPRHDECVRDYGLGVSSPCVRATGGGGGGTRADVGNQRFWLRFSFLLRRLKFWSCLGKAGPFRLPEITFGFDSTKNFGPWTRCLANRSACRCASTPMMR